MDEEVKVVTETEAQNEPEQEQVNYKKLYEEAEKEKEIIKKAQSGETKEVKRLREALEEVQKEKMTEAEKAKFEAEKRRKELEEMDRELKAERTNFIKMKVVNELGLPANLSNRIFGETEEDIRADALALQAVLSGVKNEGANEALGTISKPKAGSEDGSASIDITKLSLQEIEKLVRDGKI